MFDVGWSELLVIGVVALIAIGPKELPTALRTLGHWMGKMRRMASEFQGQFQEAMREAEMADLKKQVDDLTDTTKTFTNFDPLETVRKDIGGAVSPPATSSEPATPAPASLEAPVPVPDPAPQITETDTTPSTGEPQPMPTPTGAEPTPAPGRGEGRPA